MNYDFKEKLTVVCKINIYYNNSIRLQMDSSFSRLTLNTGMYEVQKGAVLNGSRT